MIIMLVQQYVECLLLQHMLRIAVLYAIEGFCSILAGIMGIGHGTSTFASNIGAIGLTKVVLQAR